MDPKFPEAITGLLDDSLEPMAWFPHVHTQTSRPFLMYWSRRWNYGQLHPIPSPAELEAFYGAEDYPSYLRGVATKTVGQRRLVDRLLGVLISWAARHSQNGEGTSATAITRALGGRPSRVCDVGCASGVLLSDLRAAGHSVVGIEPSATAREAAEARGLEIYEGSAERFPSQIGLHSCDLISMVQSLEHTSRPDLAIKNCVDHLKPSGLLWIEVPNHESRGFSQKMGSWFHTDAGRHIFFFGEKSLRELFKRNGLDVIEVRYVGYERQFYWVDMEQRVWDSLYRDQTANAPFGLPTPPRPGRLSSWAMLLRTVFAAPPRRFDSVILIGRKVPVTE